MQQKLILRRLAAPPAGVAVLQLSGPLTLSNLFDFQDAVRAEAAEDLILDLTEVPYIDSAGIGSLVNAHVSRAKAARRLLLVGVAERIQTMLRVTGVLKVLAIFPTVDAARESLRAAPAAESA